MAPTYDYCCTKCNFVFEELRNISDRKKSLKCPKCGEPAHIQLFGRGGNVNIVFNGTGFHCNDYKKEPHAPPAVL